MDIYRESILLELRDYSPIEYNLFKNADITYPADGKVMLTLEDTVLGKEKAEELVRILDKIYNERCGFSVEILTDYKEHKAARHKEEDEKRLAMQIAEISARAGYGTAGGSAEAAAGADGMVAGGAPVSVGAAGKDMAGSGAKAVPASESAAFGADGASAKTAAGAADRLSESGGTGREPEHRADYSGRSGMPDRTGEGR